MKALESELWLKALNHSIRHGPPNIFGPDIARCLVSFTNIIILRILILKHLVIPLLNIFTLELTPDP